MFSIIIPTMQKNIKVLNMLLDELTSDIYVNEIIIIDNSIQGIDYKSNKIKVITPQENIYVNPAWNLGVKNATSEYVGILNDDIILPRAFLKIVYNFLENKDDIGYIGLDNLPTTKEDNSLNYPQDTELIFNDINRRPHHWGSAFFFKKSNYIEIPEKLKVFCGDDFLFDTSIKKGLKNYSISNSNVIHLHSLTSKRKEFDKIKDEDLYYYKQIYPRRTLLQKFFSTYNVYPNGKKEKRIVIFGITISIN